MEESIMKKQFSVAAVVASVCIAFTLPSVAAEKEKPGALAKALTEASVSLDQGLKASEGEGKPISAKFELEHGALQLSVYTMKGDKFSEVIVDHKAGSIKKAEVITDAGDLKHAKDQSKAMAKAKLSLGDGVQSAVKANSGYSAVSAMPMLKAGHPVAEVTLMKDGKVKKVTEKLD
jgi:hypothetical protein